MPTTPFVSSFQNFVIAVVVIFAHVVIVDSSGRKGRRRHDDDFRLVYDVRALLLVITEETSTSAHITDNKLMAMVS